MSNALHCITLIFICVGLNCNARQRKAMQDKENAWWNVGFSLNEKDW